MTNDSVTGLAYSLSTVGGITTATITGLGGHSSSGPLDIPSTVTSGVTSYAVVAIGLDAFSTCSVTSLTIPDSVTSIGSVAFAYCSKLTSVTIPASVTSIGYYAFLNCSKLTSMSFLSDAPPAIRGPQGYQIYSGPNYVMFSYYPTIYVRAGTGWSDTWMGANVSKTILPTVVKHNYTVYFRK